MNYEIKGNSLVLLQSQVTSETKQQNLVYGHGVVDGSFFGHDYAENMRKIETMRWLFALQPKFTRTGDYIGTASSTIMYQLDGTKIMHVDVAWAISASPNNLKVGYKARITLPNISQSQHLNRTILRKCVELYTVKRFLIQTLLRS